MKKLIYIGMFLSSSFFYTSAFSCKVIEVMEAEEGTQFVFEVVEDQFVKAEPSEFGEYGVYLETFSCEEIKLLEETFFVVQYITKPQGTSRMVWDKVYEVFYLNKEKTKLVSALSGSLEERVYHRNLSAQGFKNKESSYSFKWSSISISKEIKLKITNSKENEEEVFAGDYLFNYQDKVFRRF